MSLPLYRTQKTNSAGGKSKEITRFVSKERPERIVVAAVAAAAAVVIRTYRFIAPIRNSLAIKDALLFGRHLIP